MRESLKEGFAEYAHEVWCQWMRYLFSKSFQLKNNSDLDGGAIIPPYLVKRWLRQMNTVYDNLSEEEKESDRKQALKIIDIFADWMKQFSTIEEIQNEGIKSGSVDDGPEGNEIK